MTKEAKGKAKVEAETPVVVKKAKVIQSESRPPVVEEGKRAVWHKPYTYENRKGTSITISGHWEIIDVTEKLEAEKKRKEAEAKEAEKAEKKPKS